MQAVSTPAIPAIAPGSLEEYEIPESSEDDIPLSPTHSEQKRRLRFISETQTTTQKMLEGL